MLNMARDSEAKLWYDIFSYHKCNKSAYTLYSTYNP